MDKPYLKQYLFGVMCKGHGFSIFLLDLFADGAHARALPLWLLGAHLCRLLEGLVRLPGAHLTLPEPHFCWLLGARAVAGGAIEDHC